MSTKPWLERIGRWLDQPRSILHFLWTSASRRWPRVGRPLGVRLVGGGAAIGLLAPLAMAPEPAAGQSSLPAQLALAQICASEASVQSETDDCAAIAQVLIRRARGGPLKKIAYNYSSRVFSRDRTDARRWIAHLSPTGEQPPGWPATLPWNKWQKRWLDLYRHAGRILRGEVANPCLTPPDHWGGEMDDWRAVKAGWNRVDCGDTFNNFWAVPGTPRES